MLNLLWNMLFLLSRLCYCCLVQQIPRLLSPIGWGTHPRCLLLRLLTALSITAFTSLGRTWWHGIHSTWNISGRRLQNTIPKQNQKGYIPDCSALNSQQHSLPFVNLTYGVIYRMVCYQFTCLNKGGLHKCYTSLILKNHQNLTGFWYMWKSLFTAICEVHTFMDQ
jgi:hypothetical protein